MNDRPRSLESWFRSGLLGYGACLFLVFALVLPSIALQIEDSLFVAQLEQELARVQSGQPVSRPFVRYTPGTLPNALVSSAAHRPSGIHELPEQSDAGSREAFIAISGDPDDSARWYLYYDVSDLEVLTSPTHPFFLVLVAAGAGLALFAVVGGWFLVRVVVQNLGRLQDPGNAERPGIRLAEVEAVAESLTSTVEHWKRAVESEGRFTRDASHELRTPLATIQGATELMVAAADQPDRVREVAARLRRANEEMQELVTVFLWLNKESVATQELLDDALPLASYVREALDGIPKAATISETRDDLERWDFQEIAHPGDPRVIGPRALILVVIKNLVRNALHHGTPGSVAIRSEGNQLRVANQVTSVESAASSESFGFGLSIVQRVCDRQGWTFEWKREPDQVLAHVDFQSPPTDSSQPAESTS